MDSASAKRWGRAIPQSVAEKVKLDVEISFRSDKPMIAIRGKSFLASGTGKWSESIYKDT